MAEQIGGRPSSEVRLTETQLARNKAILKALDETGHNPVNLVDPLIDPDIEEAFRNVSVEPTQHDTEAAIRTCDVDYSGQTDRNDDSEP